MEENPYLGKSEGELLLAAEKIDLECGGVENKTSNPESYRALMLICNTSRDPKIRERIALLANRRASNSEEANKSLFIYMNPEISEAEPASTAV